MSPRARSGPPLRLEDRPWLVLLAFVVSSLLVYAPALRGGFVWDDDDNILFSVPLRSLEGLGRIWTDVFATQQFYPLTHTTFWVQYQLWGTWTTPYHVANVLLHACAAYLLWRLLRALRMPGALLGAALFAFHPVNVESVAWVTERKNVLSIALCLGSMLAYLRFARTTAAERGSASPTRNVLWQPWLLAWVLFLLALASKTAVSVVPAVLLILVAARRGRPRWRDVVPLLPFFGAGLGAGALTAWIERVHVNAQGAPFDWSVAERVLVAGRAFWFYLQKLAWPSDLVFIYPRWNVDAHVAWQWLFPLAAVALLLGTVATRKRWGDAPAAVTWAYFILVFPALGFFNVAFMRFTYVQDHFAYYASAAALGGAAAVASALARRFVAHGALRVGAGAGVLALLAALSFRQARHYDSYESLFAHVIRANPDAWMAQYNIALHYQTSGRPRDAIAHYLEMLRLQPTHVGAHTNLAVALLATGQPAQALGYFRRAAALEPDNAATHGNLALALDDLGEQREALVHYEAATRLRSGWTMVQRRMAWMLATTPDAALVDGPRAMALAREACANTTHTLPRCLDTLAAASAAAGQFDEAQRRSAEAIGLAKQSGDARSAALYEERRAWYAAGRRLIVQRP